MPRVHPLLNNFTAGEWSGKLESRVDLAKYPNACKELLNFRPMPQGGATRRAGTHYAGDVKTSSRKTVLVPFQFSASVAYLLEVGHLYIRFWKTMAQISSGGSPVEVTTPYTEADLFELQAYQSADVLYFVHPSYAVRKLERYSDSVWKLRTVTFVPPPSVEVGMRTDVQPTNQRGIAATLAAGATTGTGVTFTAVTVTNHKNPFLASDVGREIIITGGTNAGGRATIVTFTDTTHVVADITVDFADTTATAVGNWKLTESPKTILTPTAATVLPGSATTLTLTAAGWRDPDDCHKYVQINGGVVELTAFTSTTVATGTIRGELTNATAAPSGAWGLEEAAWSTCNGFVGAVGFLDDRFYYGGTTLQPDTFWGTKVGAYENLALGTNDDDAVEFTISSGQVDRIRWIAGARGLMIGTAGREVIAAGGNDSPITPSNIQVKSDTGHGSAAMAPIKVGSPILFVTRSARKLRELVWNFEEDRYKAPDLLLLADHLTCAATVVQVSYHKEPDATLYAVRSDGVLLGCTYLREQDVVGWYRLAMSCGLFESVATIPHPDGTRDQTWVVVNRTISGSTKRSLEYFDDCGLSYPLLNTDGALTCNSATAVSTLAGLDHLEGLSVQIVADGAVLPAATVASGSVTISPSAKKVEVGLAYTSRLVTMRPEVPTAAGTSQPMKRRWVEVVVRLLESLGLTVNGDTIPFRTSADLLGHPPNLFTGDRRVPNLGWDEGRITIEQTQPLPCTVLMLTGTLELGGG